MAYTNLVICNKRKRLVDFNRELGRRLIGRTRAFGARYGGSSPPAPASKAVDMFLGKYRI